MTTDTDIAANLTAIRSRIAEACIRANRAPEAVTLVAVSKTHPQEAVVEALAAAAGIAGGIDNIKRIVKLVVFVASDPSFSGQPAVANGASELMGEIFGEAGAHVRSAFGVAVLPLDVPVELELVVEV